MRATIPYLAACSIARCGQRWVRGLRAWMLARIVDGADTGRLPKHHLLAGLERLGFARTRAYGLVGDEVADGFGEFKPVGPDRRPTVVLPGTGALPAGLAAGGDRRRVRVPVGHLLAKGYKGRLATAASAAHNGTPLSSAARRELYGAARRIQIRAEGAMGATLEANVAVHELHRHADPARLPALDGGRVFQTRGNPGAVYERLSNSTVVPVDVSRGPRRRHSPTETAKGEPTAPVQRRYYGDAEGAAAALRRARRPDAPRQPFVPLVVDKPVAFDRGKACSWTPAG